MSHDLMSAPQEADACGGFASAITAPGSGRNFLALALSNLDNPLGEIVRVKNTLAGPLIVSSLTICVLAVTANVASASAESVTDRVTEALRAVGAPHASSSPVIATDSQASIRTDHPSASITSQGKTVTLELANSEPEPAAISGADRIFGDVANKTDAVIRPSGGGVQFLSVMRSKSAPTSQRYKLTLPKSVKLKSVASGYALVGSEGQLLGRIAEPWAKDSAGRRLPTEYSIDGDYLVQRTNTAGALFPVIADPKIEFGLGVYLGLWGYEARSYAILIVAVFGAGVAVSCTLIGKLPNQILKTLATLVCVTAGINLRSVFSAIVAIYNSGALADTQCYQLKITDINDRFKPVGSSHCS